VLKLRDILAAGDKVVVRWSDEDDPQQGALCIAATDKTVGSRGISIATIDKGKIVGGRDNWDQFGMLEQLGAYTPPEGVILAKTA
jgi:hypothetical protein